MTIHNVEPNDIRAVLLAGVWYDVDVFEEMDADTIAFLIGRARLRVFCAKSSITAVAIDMDLQNASADEE